MKPIWRLSLSVFTPVLLATTALAVAYGFWSGTRPLNPGPDIYVIQPGSGVSQLARLLRQRGVVKETYSLAAWAYLMGHTRKIQAGEYRFPAGASLQQILQQTVDGRVVQYPLTLIEGWTFSQVRAVLERAPKLRTSLPGKAAEDIVRLLSLESLNMEGIFYPDTYFYTADTEDIDVLKQASRRMQTELAAAWADRPQDTILQSPEEVLILASIIEKETGLPEERPRISAVFHNRLKRGMRLQTDPTVIYGLGESFDGNLTRRDLRSDTPYNTYLRKGLPPTPIALPSGDAIRAALHPAQTNALYFVARGDGSHEFSDTLEAHNRAVARYQLGVNFKPSSPVHRNVTP